ncbi:LPS assembly lipoprotein LptE [Paracraurococcus lichenis]|uniref:LPS assembly lipoprotein LptE n=1 Tax=Paracraurococcus lichenis TaxID=3064888 RepID=A0ABT9E7K5_9PROT|nr:LPS assembly lipoprotein LptE [Paracraurococcus sp. LOR1-02]MDO9712168.1 LPS assembly lipoprotein LptE [Paracraurococcus sp. LOR1-02]
MCRAVSSTSSSDGRAGRPATRRALLGAVGLLGLSGCGFRPLYGPVTAADGSEADLTTELAAVRIGPIYERTGQLLRRNLQRRMEDSAPGTPARYQLNVSYVPGLEVLGYRRDGTITRIRYTFTGNWDLATLSVPPQPVARSIIPYRALDSFNIPDLQFFSADSARDAMEARAMEMMSEEITRQVAMALRKRREAGTATG